ncbi:MAG TPA: hypothetical protein VGN22_12415, partial [Pseudonocardia sp.]
GNLSLESVSFDPNLPDPNEDDGKFNTLWPDFEYMREVVQNSINKPSPPAATAAPNPSADPTTAPTTTKSRSGSTATTKAAPDSSDSSDSPQPESLAASCT